MSIHMHDLQVQNKITSKNEIETSTLKATNTIETEILKATTRITSSDITVNNMNLFYDVNKNKGGSLTFAKKDTTGEINEVCQIGISGNSPIINIYDAGSLLLQKAKDGQTYVSQIGIDNNGNLTTTDEGYILLHQGNIKSYIEGQSNWNIEVNSLAIDGVNLTEKTFSIAGNDVTIWGGRLESETLANSLLAHIKVSTLDTGRVGSSSQPIYINENGQPVMCDEIQATITAASKLLDSGGNDLTSDKNVPVYFKDGVAYECEQIKNSQETYILSDTKLKLNHVTIQPFSLETNESMTICFPPLLGNPETQTFLTDSYMVANHGWTYGTNLPDELLVQGQIYFKLISE